jgi:hypothetical protein
MSDEQGAGALARTAGGPARQWRQRLVGAVAEAVDATPGVVRREASVADFFRGLRGPGDPAEAGIRVSASGSKVAVSVHLSVDGSGPALRVGERVREAVAEAVAAEGWTPASVEVAILDVGDEG